MMARARGQAVMKGRLVYESSTPPVIGLTRKSGAALHHQLYSILHSGIVQGGYPNGSLLPGEDALASIYQVSRATVRRALQSLEEKGMVTRQAGVGTRVVSPVRGGSLRSALVELVGPLIDASQLKLIFFGFVAAPHEIADMLEVPAGTRVLQVSRLRLNDSTPLRFTHHYLLEEIGVQLTRERIEGRLIYDALKDLGLKGGGHRNIIGAVLADAVHAAILKVEPGAPLLEILAVLRDSTGSVLMAQQSFSPSERERLLVDLSGAIPASAIPA